MLQPRSRVARLVTLPAAAFVALLSGCLDGGQSGQTTTASYTIYHYVNVVGANGATATGQVEYIAADGDTEAYAPTAFPWQVAAGGYQTGDTLRLRVHGTAVSTSVRGTVTRTLSVWGTSPDGTPLDFGASVFTGPAGDFDDDKTVILP
jgi:hypothetical protein